MVIIFVILITSSLGYVQILQGEIYVDHYWNIKYSQRGPLLPPQLMMHSSYVFQEKKIQIFCIII